MRPKIAIIGGGIGGLTAAVALARKGLAAEVYEQAPVLEEVGAGVGLWPNALTALAPAHRPQRPGPCGPGRRQR